MVIICSLKPFIFTQKIMVFNEDGSIETTATVAVNNFVELLCNFVNKYKCKKITMTGSKIYAKGFEEKIRECYLAKYGENDLEIEYI